MALLDYTANDREQVRQGNRSPQAAPHGAYPCRGEDRWCVIAVHSQEEWEAFSQCIGHPEWVRDPRFATLEAQKENELDCLVATWTLDFTPEEVVARLQRAGVAAGVVENAQDLLEKDPQLKHRGYFKFLEQPELGLSSHIDWPAQLSLTPTQFRRAPLLGEHTEMVCKEFLEMSDQEFRELLAAGVLE